MMPELPEVETLCRQLNAILPGEEILAVEVLDPRLGMSEGEGLAGRKIESGIPSGEIHPDRNGQRRPIIPAFPARKAPGKSQEKLPMTTASRRRCISG